MSEPRKNPSRGPNATKPTVGNDDNNVDPGSNNEMNGNLEASNPQPSPMASSPTRPNREVPDEEDFDCRPAGPPKRTTTSSSQQQNIKSASSSATKQKREGKLASPMKGSSQKKKTTDSKATKQVDSKKGVRTAKKSNQISSEKMAGERPNAQNSVLLSPSSKGSSRSDRGIEKTRVTTRAVSAGHDRDIEKTRVTTRAASAGHDRDSSNNNNGNGSEDENENDYRDDCSMSTAPAPPSLRVGNHYSLRPGAYRMGLGGVARYVDGANDDIDNYSTTNMEDSVLGDSEAVDTTVTLDARLVEEESILSPPLYRPTTSEGYTVSDQRTYGYDRSVQENSEYGCRSADQSTVGVTSTAPTATTFTSRTTTVMEEENSYVEENDTDVVKSFKKRNMKVIVSSVFLFIIVIASVGAAYSVKRSRRNNNNQITPLDPLQSFIETLPDHTKESLRIENSPQSKAIDWMSKYDDIELYPLPRQLQRFVLMSLTNSITIDDLSHEALKWMALTDECIWYESKCEDNIYTELSLRSVHPLQGTIIPELALLASLESLQIDQNAFFGMIPTEIGQMTALKRIHMNNNLLRGTIPTEFGKLANLTDINLSDNMLSGSIPKEIVSWNKVHTFLLAHNALSGTIPTEIGRMTELTTVSLALNKLEGQLPPTVRLLKRMERFDIKDNFIDGEFVSKFEHMGPTLKFLQLGSNDFAGTLSSKIGLLTNLEVLDISNNELKGTIPEEVGLMTSLIDLRLNSNAFDDLIPPELGLLSNAQSMALHGNQFTGSVPFEICELTTLTKKELTVDCDLVFCLCCTCG